MKVGIITLATGERHNKMCQNFLSSLYKHFDSTVETKVCVIGDDDSYLKRGELYHKIVNLPSPLITLLRFYFMKQVSNLFMDCDVVFYFDSDMEIIADININDILPDSTQITVVKHPWATSDQNGWLLEVGNVYSTAQIDNVPEYYQGCFFGATPSVFFSMVEQLTKNINADLGQRIIAVWFDESHLNKFVHDKPRRVLTLEYATPTTWFRSLEIHPTTKILHKNSYSN